MKVIIYEIDEDKEKKAAKFFLENTMVKYKLEESEQKEVIEKIIVYGVPNFQLNKKILITEGKLFLESLLLYFRGSYVKAILE